MLAIRTERRVYQRCRELDKARTILLSHETSDGKKIPKTAFIEYGPADVKRYGVDHKRPEQLLPLGQYCLGHIV
jgi:hypothetical protein